jgi:hypothetical protein
MAKKDWLDRLFDISGKMYSTSPHEAAVCLQQINKLLQRHGKTGNDIPELLDIVRKRRAPPSPPPAPAAPPPPGDPIELLELFEGMRAVSRQYLSLEEDEYTVLTLWCMHAHVYRQFMHTPRLILSAAVRDCGKTTALDVIGSFVPYPKKSDHMSAPTFFRLTDWGHTLLLDEVDNLGLLKNAVFRAAFNSGHRRGGTIDRTINGQLVTFKTSVPVVLAGIGNVPLPQARRSIDIRLKRDPKAPINRKQFDSEDEKQREMFALISAHLTAWAADCKLATKPPMPEGLTGGQCDNWRPLISIADACGPEVGELAREIAVKMCRTLDEDFEVLLLRDIRDLFDQKRADRLASAAIVDNLNLLPHGLWVDWRGKHDTDAPRPMTAGIMAKLLAPFGIRPATIWPLDRNADSKSSRGYFRSQFEDAWARYCQEADTPTQSSKIMRLRGR